VTANVVTCREHNDLGVDIDGGRTAAERDSLEPRRDARRRSDRKLDYLTAAEFDYLVNLRQRGAPFFIERRAGGAWTCIFGGYVGAIALPGGRTLELLPKTVGETPVARAAVMRMLAATGLAPAVEGDLGQYAACPHLIEAYLRVAAHLTHEATRTGLVQTYRREHLRSPAIRGRWRIGAQLARLPERVDAHLLDADIFTADTPVNRALKAGISWVDRRTTSPATLALCRSVLARMDVVRTLPLSQAALSSSLAGLPPLDRRHAHLGKSLAALRLVVGGHGSEIAAGDDAPGPAWLFATDKLFEAYVAQRMRRIASRLSVVIQGPSRWFDTAERFRLRPDITAHRHGKPFAIFDTKWKQVETALGISEDDIRQIYAYARVYRTASAMLLYPATSGQAGKVADIIVQDEAKTRLAAWCIPLPETTSADGDGTLKALLADIDRATLL
jgi:5-methylcytosine-specific restriction enzyme subunit McrC